MRCAVVSSGRGFVSAFARPRNRRIMAAAALAAGALAGKTARAVNVTDTWLTAATGNWTDPTKWSAGVVPNNGADTYSVVIGATGAAYTVSLNTNDTVNDFTLNAASATFSQGGGTFSVIGSPINLQ